MKTLDSGAECAPPLEIDEKEKIFLDATIQSVLGYRAFRAVLGNGHFVVAFCTLHTRAAPADLVEGARVKLEFSPFDLGKGRIL